MDHSELKSRLPKALADQVEGLWKHFGEETGAVDTQRFFGWLQQKGHLSNSEFQALILEQELDITGFEDTETFLSTRGVYMDATGGDSTTHGSGPGGRNSTSPLTPHSQYEMLGMLGKGAMGLVHLAKDRDLQRKVAYKQLLGQGNRSALARFVREAQITAQLDHPHIVPIYSMEVQPDGSLAYSMKLVQGKTFKELITETRGFYDRGENPDAEHSLPQLLDYFLKACDAIAFAHSKGVIHRDLKPANIMVGRYNEVYVMDWGIARVMTHSDTMPEGWVELGAPESDKSLDEQTRAGQILGTPRYMSPQQAAGKNDELDGRSDEFAMGLILYELLTLKPAFTAGSPIELLKKVLKAEKQPWQTYHASRRLAPELQAVVDKATRQKPADRYDGVSGLASDLRRHLRGEAPLVRPDNGWRRLVRWVGRHRELSLMVLAAVIVAAALIVMLNLIQHQRELEQVRQREARLLDFVGRISHQGQRMDIYFEKMEGLLRGLTKATQQALAHGMPSKDPWYINNPYAQPPRKLFEAPDLIPSPYYTGEISTTWPVFVISPGVSIPAIAPKLRLIAGLRYLLKDILVDSYTDGPPPPKPVWDQLLANQGVPLMWAYICLKEGVEFFYPGHDEPTKGYDVRVRSYYTQSYNKHEIVWGVPYDDLVAGLLIPCTQGLFDEQGRFLGTVGIDMRINNVDKAFLHVPDEPAVETSYLLNHKGEIVLRSGDAAKPRHRLSMTEKNVLKRYPHPQVVAAILQQRRGGTLSDDPTGSGHLIAYYRLNTLGWYFVVEADYAKLTKSN